MAKHVLNKWGQSSDTFYHVIIPHVTLPNPLSADDLAYDLGDCRSTAGRICAEFWLFFFYFILFLFLIFLFLFFIFIFYFLFFFFFWAAGWGGWVLVGRSFFHYNWPVIMFSLVGQ